MLFIGFPYGLNKMFMASNEYCFLAHCTFHCTLYIAHQFFQAVHGLLLATSAVKMQLNDVIKSMCWYRPFVHSFANTNRYC